MNIGIKNSIDKKYTGMFDGNAYDFAPGELRILEAEIAVHLATNSNLAAIGKPALKIIPLDQIPEELLKSPSTDTKTIMGVKNPTENTVEVRYDGRFFTFPKGHVAYYEKSVALEIINRSVVDGKMALVKYEEKKENKPNPPANSEESKKGESKKKRNENENK